MHFENPWAFLLMLLPVALLVAIKRSTGRPAVSFSSLSTAACAGKSIRQRLAGLPEGLVLLSVIFLVAAVARPQRGVTTVASTRKGVAMEMLMDISSSMDINLESSTNQVNRMEAAKRVFADFIIGDNDLLPGRHDDIIGLITFARYADTVCPMTTSLPALTTIVDELEVEDRPNEDGTAYGDALVLAAARLMKIDEIIEERGYEQEKIKSKIIILLTDGENNCGKHLPAQAAALAQEWGIKVYAIFLGNRPLGTRTIRPGLTLTQQQLIRICERTGGICRMVYDYDSLRSVYAEIDDLEKSELNLFTEFVYREYFQLFVMIALLCLGLGIVLDTTVMRRAP